MLYIHMYVYKAAAIHVYTRNLQISLHRITDAYNNARDRVRYLEALSPHLEVLRTNPPPSPSSVVSSTLPALASVFRQMDGLTRVYARSGYLGVILTKVRTHVQSKYYNNL